MNILVLGAGGFIFGHLAKKLHENNHRVIAVDIKPHDYWSENEMCTHFVYGDLRDPLFVDKLFTEWETFDEVYQGAADMGGAGYIFTGEHDADVMHNSAMINLNVAKAAVQYKAGRVFYSSSACMYPEYNQLDPENPNCSEDSAYPAAPDSEYGWEKLFSERLYHAFMRNYGLQVRIARFHNIFGPQGTWTGGREKAPAAICRKVAEGVSWNIGEQVSRLDPNGNAGVIDIWGDGLQTRSFLYIDECVEGIIRLMRSDCTKVLNIGSEEMISINDLAKMVIDISGKNLIINNIDGPTGVRGRNSDNTLIRKELNWAPERPLREGMEKLYSWINQQVTNE